MRMTPGQKGAIAETAIVAAAVELGVQVYRPVAEGGRYDLVFDAGGGLLRIQCKWAGLYGDVIIVRCRTCRRTNGGFRRTTYGADEIDAIAAYCFDLRRCYLLPIERFQHRKAIQLRLAPSKNNQHAGVNWAEEFEFEATLGPAAGL